MKRKSESMTYIALGIRQMRPLPAFIQSNIKRFSQKIRQEKEIKGIELGREEFNLLPIMDDMIINIEKGNDAIIFGNDQ